MKRVLNLENLLLTLEIIEEDKRFKKYKITNSISITVIKVDDEVIYNLDINDITIPHTGTNEELFDNIKLAISTELLSFKIKVKKELEVLNNAMIILHGFTIN